MFGGPLHGPMHFRRHERARVECHHSLAVDQRADSQLCVNAAACLRRRRSAPEEWAHRRPLQYSSSAPNRFVIFHAVKIVLQFRSRRERHHRRLERRRELHFPVQYDPMISRRGFLAVPLSASALAQTPPIYDLLLKNGHVLDFRNKRNGRFDIALVKDKVVRVAPDLPVAHARLVLNLSDYYVTPGLIDIHTHFDAGGADLNLQPDHHALPNGVTTAVDAGGSGYRNFEAFKSRTIDQSKTRILAWLNIVGAGMYGPEVENDVAQMDAAACAAMVKKYPDLIVGIKTAPLQPPTWDGVDRALKAGELAATPVMVDFAQRP